MSLGSLSQLHQERTRKFGQGCRLTRGCRSQLMDKRSSGLVGTSIEHKQMAAKGIQTQLLVGKEVSVTLSGERTMAPSKREYKGTQSVVVLLFGILGFWILSYDCCSPYSTVLSLLGIIDNI